MQLITISDDRMVCAKELHKFLDVGAAFNVWIARRIKEYDLVQDVDFIAIRNDCNDIKELKIAIDVAKELCMVEKNDKGKQARKYFIQVEKDWQERRKNMTQAEKLLEHAQQMVEQERRIRDIVLRTESLEDRLDLLSPDTGYCTIRGMARMLGVKISEDQALKLGRQASHVCKSLVIQTGKVSDERHGSVNSYPIEILKPIFEKWSTNK